MITCMILDLGIFMTLVPFFTCSIIYIFFIFMQVKMYELGKKTPKTGGKKKGKREKRVEEGNFWVGEVGLMWKGLSTSKRQKVVDLGGILYRPAAMHGGSHRTSSWSKKVYYISLHFVTSFSFLFFFYLFIWDCVFSLKFLLGPYYFPFLVDFPNMWYLCC